MATNNMRRTIHQKLTSVTFSMTWGHVKSVVEDMAHYAYATATVSPDMESVTLTRSEGIAPIVIERARSFGWELAQPVEVD